MSTTMLMCYYWFSQIGLLLWQLQCGCLVLTFVYTAVVANYN